MIFQDEDEDNLISPADPQSIPMESDQAIPAALAPTPAPDASALDLSRVLASPSTSPELKAAAAKRASMADYSPEARKALLDSANNSDIGSQIGAALSAIGTGFQGGNATQAASQFMQNDQKQKEQKLANFDQAKAQQVESDQMDPNSEASQRFRATLKANFPQIADKYGDSFDNLTAGDQKTVFQVAETKAKLDEAAAKRESVAATKDLNNQLRREAAGEKAKAKTSEADNKDAQNLDKHLSLGWTGRSGQAGAVQAKINAAEAAEKLIEQGKTQPGGLDSRQYEELAVSTNKLLNPSGGGASERIQALVPHTFWGGKQTLEEYLSNRPKGQDFQAFTDRLADTVAREKELATNQKRQFQIEGLAPYARLQKSNPELYNKILSSKGIDSSMINEKGQYQAPKTIIKTQTNQKTGEKRNVYSDGSTEIVGGNQVAGGDQ